MSYYDMLPDETNDQRQERWARINNRTKNFEKTIESIYDLSRELGRTASTSGFIDAWLSIMFKDLSEEKQENALERFKDYDSELMLSKISDGNAS